MEIPFRSLSERVNAPDVLPELPGTDILWRAATYDDAAVMAEFNNVIARADGEPFLETVEEQRDQLSAPWRDLPTTTRLGFDADGRLIASGSVTTPPGDVTLQRAFVFGAVHPDRRAEGIGTGLQAWLVARARQLLVASGKELPSRIVTYAEDNAPASKLALQEAGGFVIRRWFSTLKRPIGADHPLPEVQLDESLRLVPWREELDEAARLAHNDAFRDHWGSQPQTAEQWTRNREDFVPTWSWLVVDDAPDVQALLADPATDSDTAAALEVGAPLVVGYHYASRYESDFEYRGYAFGFTDLLGVRRSQRGRKIGIAALTAGIRSFATDGMEAAVLDVDTDSPTGADGLYERLGYVKVSGSHAATIEL